MNSSKYALGQKVFTCDQPVGGIYQVLPFGINAVRRDDDGFIYIGTVSWKQYSNQAEIAEKELYESEDEARRECEWRNNARAAVIFSLH